MIQENKETQYKWILIFNKFSNFNYESIYWKNFQLIEKAIEFYGQILKNWIFH